MSQFSVQSVIDLARQAGARIMFHRGKVASTAKHDGSPVTIADKEASDIIVKGLKALTPSIPVISEEASEADNKAALSSDKYWVTDPLDGTRTFLRGHDGFGVHIALIDNGVPVIGVAFFPAKENGLLYYTGDDKKAYIQDGNNSPQAVRVSKGFSAGQLRVAVAHKKDRQPPSIQGQFYRAVNGVGGERLCLTAAGKADVSWMVRENTTWSYSWWDVAAGHAILKAAGGEVVTRQTGKPFIYDQKAPHFGVPDIIGAHPQILRRLSFTS